MASLWQFANNNAPAIFGLIGTCLGASLTIGWQWWFQSKNNKKNATYLSVIISCELDRYIAGCVEVVGDNGLFEGQRDPEGYCRPTTKNPVFAPLSFDVDWKSLPGNLMHDLLDLPYKAELANNRITFAGENSFPPDYDEFFDERQHQYATLGITANELANRLRNHANLPARTYSDWNPIEYMKEQRDKIDSSRMRRHLKNPN